MTTNVIATPDDRSAGDPGKAISIRIRLRLFRRFLDLRRGGKGLAAGPGMLGDVEQHALGPVHLHLEPADPLRLALIHVVLAALARGLRRRLVEILDEDAEM